MDVLARHPPRPLEVRSFVASVFESLVAFLPSSALRFLFLALRSWFLLLSSSFSCLLEAEHCYSRLASLLSSAAAWSVCVSYAHIGRS